MDLDAEAHPGQAGHQIYLFWVLLKFSSGKEGRPHWGGKWTCVGTTLTVINFKVPALSHLLPPSFLPACQICAGLGEKKCQYPNKGQNLKTGSFFVVLPPT